MISIQLLKDFYHYLSAKFHGLSFYTAPFYHVGIETTTICNRRCKYCPQSIFGNPHEKMEEELFYKIINSLKHTNFIGIISPSLYGEPLTDDRILTFVKYIRVSLAHVYIRIFTNGDFLTVDKYLELKRAGVDIFVITQHSKVPSETLVNTLTYIKNNHQKFYAVKYYNFYDEYYNKKNANGLLSNRGGLVDVPIKKRSYCHMVNQVTIDYQGNVLLCCDDYNRTVKLGNVQEREISDIWYDPKYVKIRKMLNNGIWPYEMCRKCTGNDQ